MCPDQPTTEGLVPRVNDVYGNLSNLLIDWMKVAKFVNYKHFLTLQISNDATRIMEEA